MKELLIVKEEDNSINDSNSLENQNKPHSSSFIGQSRLSSRISNTTEFDRLIFKYYLIIFFFDTFSYFTIVYVYDI